MKIIGNKNLAEGVYREGFFQLGRGREQIFGWWRGGAVGLPFSLSRKNPDLASLYDINNLLEQYQFLVLITI